MAERSQLWTSRGRGEEERAGLQGHYVGSNIDKSLCNGH